MVYLVGVDHIIQHEGFMFQQKKECIARFKDYLRAEARRRGVTLLAEEFSESLLDMNQTKISAVRDVANELQIEHRFCDPTSQERETEEIISDDQREFYWLEKIRDAIERNIMFVCGDSHIDTFSVKLKKVNVEVEVISTNWGTNLTP